MKTKTQFMNRILSLVLSIMMVVSMLPMNILTANAAETTESAIDLSTLTGTYVISDSGEYTFTGSGSYGIKVESGNPTIVLNNASIMVGEGSAIDVASGSNATIFVLGDNTIGTTKTGYPDVPCGGIFVAEGGTVNITSNSTANILRAHGSNASAIGGKYDYDNNESYNAGNINISNVAVYAYTNNFHAAAIGAAGEGTCGTINITNAVVYVYGAGDRWTSAPGIGNAWSLLDWSDTIPIVIISDSEVHTFRYNPYSDYIGYLGDESGDTYATGSINCGDGGSVKNSTIYCYTGLDATTTDKVVKYGALGGLLKEDGTCEGEHSGGTATCKEQAICGNCGASYGELLDHNWKNGECTYGCNTQHDPHDWESGICNVCGLVCAHTGGAATCTTLAVCDICGTSYGEVGGHTPAENATYTDNGDGTHSFTCSVCGASINKAHSMDSTTGKCVCSLEMAEASATIGGVTTYYSTLDAAIWAVRYTTEADNAIVKLLMDCEHVNIEGGVFTLNLAGNSLSTENTQSAVLDVIGGTVTVTGGTISGTRKAVEVVGGTLNITEGTTITTMENHTNSKTVKVRDGTLNISGGTITGPVKGVFVQDGTVNITGGTIETQGNKESGSVYIEGGTVNISGGSFIDKFALYMEGGTAYVTGGTFQSSNRYALSMLGGTAYVTGGTFTSDGYADISCTNGTVILGMNEESGVGATFPNDLTVSDTTLNAILADGASYWQGEKMIVPSEDQTQITGGDVIIKAACMHENGTPSYTPNEDNEYTHYVTWSCCDTTVTEEHNFENAAHQCICGKAETFNVYWALSNSLMQSTSTYGQDFTQTFTVPENTHLEIYGVHLEDDSTVQVNYTYENGVLTIAAADLPAADVYIDCYHYIEVKFHANGGVIKPHEGYPVPGDTGFAEDGSYWIHKFAVGQEIDNFANAEMSRTGYTFVEWRDASGKLYPMNVPGRVEPYILATEDVTLYAQWQCNHTIGGVVFRDNGNGTHNGYCGECDELLGNYVEHPHNFGDNTHKCVCGKKVTPEVTAPTAKTILIYDGSEQELINAGSTTGGTLQYSLDNVTWSAEIPTAITVGTHTVYYKVVGDENYEDVEAQSIIVTITDKTAPTGTILIKENGWNKFWNTITFGIFCKDYVDVTVTADGTGSGVSKVEYQLSDTVLEENNIPNDGWTTLNADNGKYSFSIKPQNKVAVYVRITDEGGNVTVINSDGIVVYEDSEAVDTEVTYTYKENSNKDISVEFNGNTVKSIVCGEKTLAANSDYTVDYENGKIVLTASYLDTLNAGDYTFTVSYNPMGVENSGVTDLTTTFTVKVEPTSIAGATVNVSGTFTFDGNAKTPDPAVVLNGETLVKDRDYAVSYAENVNAGTATVTVTGKGNYSGTANDSFRIERAKLTDISVQQNGKLTYNGEALTPAVTANATALNDAKVYFIYSADGSAYGSMPTFTDAGTYTVYYCAYTVDNNFFDHHDTFTVTIDKATVTEPTIASKPYNGTAQTADISGTDLYTVEKNNGGTEKGSYDVVLKLKDSANYKWSTTDNAEVTLQFVISAAQNAWDTNPSISGWTYGEAAKTPVGTAKYGAAKVVYTGKANDGTDYNSENAPTKAGNYTATFTVTGTEDYSGLSEQVNFTIAKKAVTVTANDASKTYGDSDPALTYTHTELVGSDALVITVARASGENANTYTITASQAEGANPNYEITFKTGTFTIRKAPLTVTVEDKTATYGDAVPTYPVKYDGFKNGDDKDDLGGALAFDCGYAQFSDKGEYTIKASGYTSGNYTISYVDGKLTVNAKPITVTIQNATSVYGDTLAELKATDNGIVNGDANVYSLATTATGTSNVGKYAISGTALDDNYDVTFANGEYEITKREITITVDAKNTVVNTTLPTYTYKVEGLVGVDALVTEPTLTCNANIALIGEYDITASGADAGDNYSIKYVPAKLTVLTDNAVDAAAGYTEELKDYDPTTVTSEDKAELDEMLSEINTILADETTTDNGKKALEEVKEQVEKLIKEITDAAEATDTENTEKVENVTPENVTPENKTDLEGAKADLEKALEDNGGNYTEDEKKAIEDEIKRIDDALKVIGNVEAVEKVISKLPAVDTVKPDDEEAIKAITDAQTAYNALSDYEKSLVDEATKAALDKLAAALVAYDIVEGDGSSWTEDSEHNITFVVNGLFSKFVGIKVDGKDVDKANYEVNAGSTIITLKASYMDTLAVGEHTISVVYTDGSTDGTFNVRAKANSPATGDNSNMFLWVALLFISGGAVITLTVVERKKRVATKR